jgi:hypothetical protein
MVFIRHLLYKNIVVNLNGQVKGLRGFQTAERWSPVQKAVRKFGKGDKSGEPTAISKSSGLLHLAHWRRWSSKYALDNSIFICTIICTGGALWKL